MYGNRVGAQLIAYCTKCGVYLKTDDIYLDKHETPRHNVCKNQAKQRPHPSDIKYRQKHNKPLNL